MQAKQGQLKQNSTQQSSRSLWSQAELAGSMSTVFDDHITKAFMTSSDGKIQNNSIIDDPTKLDYFTEVLLGLTQYDSLELRMKAFRMLMRHNGPKEALAACMSKVCLCISPAVLLALHDLNC